jgi:hypothetical protein
MRLALSMMLACLGTGFLAAGVLMPNRLVPEHRRLQARAWLRGWFIKGWFVPLFVWSLMNFGLSWTLPPFMPQIQFAQNKGGGWLLIYLAVISAGFFVISTYWTAVTLGWILTRTARRLEGDTLSDFKALCWTAFLGMLLPALGIALLGGWKLIGMAAAAILLPIAGYAPSIIHTVKMPPMYAKAIAKMKFGKYSEAEWEIINQLEKSHDDFEGWMILADLYANQFNDIAEAEQTVLDICEQPKTTAPQLSIALHRLADWHLKRGDDPDAARRALQMIADRLPGSHLAHMAQLRMNQLPQTTEELREQRVVKPIPLPALGDAFDESPAEPASKEARKEAEQSARTCVEKLTRNPNDVDTRERLARLLAEKLDQSDTALDQLALLFEMPEQPDGRRAEWLGLMAAWHFKYRQDAVSGRKTLEQLVDQFPNTSQAFAARRRLRLLAQKA